MPKKLKITIKKPKPKPKPKAPPIKQDKQDQRLKKDIKNRMNKDGKVRTGNKAKTIKRKTA